MGALSVHESGSFAIEAEIESDNAKILTDPMLTLQEENTATVSLVQEVFGGVERTVDVSTDEAGNVVSEVIEEPIIKEAGIKLEVTIGKIDDNGFVRMAVNPTISSPFETRSTEAGEITLLQKRTLESGQIRLRDGQTLILSGIIQDSDRTTVSKVPILGDIPLLGALFRSTEREQQRREVIVVVTPQILDNERGQARSSFQPSPEARQMLRQPPAEQAPAPEPN
ncbi:MAG: hypothetical protein BRC58_05240 [Cyanobacteria bacterium QS_8_64_29]|nr:MAG: hypothetical protein BRC58_05240 [Cyanobacteria bacterium QS_8_64_29]